MVFRPLLLLDSETWLQLKILAGLELVSPRNFVRSLIEREWETRQSETRSTQPEPVKSPSIPSIYHICQRK